MKIATIDNMKIEKDLNEIIIKTLFLSLNLKFIKETEDKNIYLIKEINEIYSNEMKKSGDIEVINKKINDFIRIECEHSEKQTLEKNHIIKKTGTKKPFVLTINPFFLFEIKDKDVENYVEIDFEGDKKIITNLLNNERYEMKTDFYDYFHSLIFIKRNLSSPKSLMKNFVDTFKFYEDIDRDCFYSHKKDDSTRHTKYRQNQYLRALEEMGIVKNDEELREALEYRGLYKCPPDLCFSLTNKSINQQMIDDNHSPFSKVILKRAKPYLKTVEIKVIKGEQK